MNESKHYSNKQNITEIDLLKANNQVKEEIEEKFDKKFEKIEKENAENNNALVKVQVLLETVGKNSEDIKKELKEDRIERRKKDEEHTKRYNDLEKQIESVKSDLNKNVENLEKRITEDIKDLKLGLDSKLNIEDFEEKYREIESNESDDGDFKKFLTNAALTFFNTALTSNVIYQIVQHFFK